MSIDQMYDETEHTTTRFVGFFGSQERFDLVITQTEHFYGKKLVVCMQTNRSAILSREDAENPAYLYEAFQLRSETDAEEMSSFLSFNI